MHRLMSDAVSSPVDALSAVLHDWDRTELIHRLNGAQLSWWEEIDRQLELVHPDLAQAYPDTIAELVLAPWHFDGLSDDEFACLGCAIDRMLGGVDRWMIVEGDWNTDAESSSVQDPMVSAPSIPIGPEAALSDEPEYRYDYDSNSLVDSQGNPPPEPPPVDEDRYLASMVRF
jgi:hypothetical protein